MVKEYERLGISPKERGMIIGCIKRVFSRSNKAVRIRRMALSQDKTGPRGGKLFTCAVCGVLSGMGKVQVDHKDPVVPVDTTLQDMDLTTIIRRLWCDDDNLQVLCLKCHKEKTKRERKLRKEYRDARKKISNESKEHTNVQGYTGRINCLATRSYV